MTTTSPSKLSRVAEWLWRSTAVRQARAQLGQRVEARERCADQARLLIEVARRVAKPPEALPKGSRAAVLAGLYRDAIVFALASEATADATAAAGPLSVAALWAATPPDKLAKVAGDEATLAAVRLTLDRLSAPGLLDVTDEEAARLRAFAEGLVWDLEAPTRAVERLVVQRWTRVALVAVVTVLLVLGVLGVRALLRPTDLAAAKNFKTSTSYADCTAPNKCADLLFHTLPQDNPWVDFDLGAVKSVRGVEVTNRSDCCAERTVPLVIEISTDDKTWTEVARRDAEFTTWTAKFPKRQARYVRLRIPRNSTLHLDDVVVF